MAGGRPAIPTLRTGLSAAAVISHPRIIGSDAQRRQEARQTGYRGADLVELTHLRQNLLQRRNVARAEIRAVVSLTIDTAVA